MNSSDEQRAKKDAVTIGQIRKRIERHLESQIGELPNGLRIKGRVPSVHQDATFKSKPSRGWYITNACGAAGMYYLTNRGEWTNGIQSNADSFWPTRAAALEACYLFADLPKIDGCKVHIWQDDDCFRVDGSDLPPFDSARDAYLAVMAAAPKAPNASEGVDGGLKLRLEPCESWGKYVLEIWNGERWEALHPDYLSVVEAMKQKIEAASHDTAELTRLREERDHYKDCAERYAADTRNVMDQRDEARRLLAEADRELQTIEAIAFGGLMPDGWNLDGLAGRLRLALIERDRERAELAERAAKWDSIVGVLVEKLKETPAVQSAARAAGGE
jgi:hypothetical protein